MTINNFKTLFESIADNHFQIKSFGFGKVQEIEGVDSSKYVRMWVVPGSSTVLDNTIERTFNILIFDLVHKDLSNETEVLSDTEQILDDVIRILKYDNDNYTITNSPTLNPFTERFGDDCTGYSAEITIETDHLESTCDIPMDEYLEYVTTACNGIQEARLTCSSLAVCPVIISIDNELTDHETRIEALEAGSGGLDCDDVAACQVIIDLQTSISQEETARQNADTALQNAISQEVTDRQAQGMYLENYIDQVSNDLSVHSTDTNNPHQTTLEQARSQNSSLSGDINANTNTIINIRDAVNQQEPITKIQFDSYNASVGRQRGAIDCSSNPNYPASNVGDRWEVTVAGKIGGASGIDVQVYDEIVCKTQSVAGDQATVGTNFYIVQGNLERASETVSGYTQYATDAEVQAETDNAKTFTPLKLGNWWVAKKLLNNTWAGIQSFFNIQSTGTVSANNIGVTGVQTMHALTASKVLATNASKQIQSITLTKSIGLSLDGQGGVISTGSKGFSLPSFNGTIVSWNIKGDDATTGDIVIDIKRNGVSIVGAGNKPTITTANYNSANVSGWTSTTITAGDYIEYNVDSVSTFKTINLVIKIEETI